MSESPNDLQKSVYQLAASHGLELDESTFDVKEMGLDFRVVLARAVDGERWALRIPRRDDVTQRAHIEGKLLNLVAPQLTTAVPDWRINAPDLIAYPLLPGEPGLELTETGEPEWRVDVSTPEFAESLGDFLAELHAIDADTAAATGIESHTPLEVRDSWATDIDTVVKEFTVSEHLRTRWDAWLSDDSYWPDFSVLTHGEVYPAHTLVEGNTITAILDWTTASVGDPAKDFMFHQASASAEAFQITVDRYVERGGTVWPKLAEHCAELFSASPVGYGVFALTTGEKEHFEAAAAQLNPH